MRRVRQKSFVTLVALVETIEGSVDSRHERLDLGSHLGHWQARFKAVDVDMFCLGRSSYRSCQSAPDDKWRSHKHHQCCHKHGGSHQYEVGRRYPFELVYQGQRRPSLHHDVDSSSICIDPLETSCRPTDGFGEIQSRPLLAIQDPKQRDIAWRDIAMPQLVSLRVAHYKPEVGCSAQQPLHFRGRSQHKLSVGSMLDRPADDLHRTFPTFVHESSYRAENRNHAEKRQQAGDNLQEDEISDQSPAQGSWFHAEVFSR